MTRRPVFFDVLFEHNPPGTKPGENVDSGLRIQVWVKKVPAFGLGEAQTKAESFLARTGATGAVFLKGRFSAPPDAPPQVDKQGDQGNDTIFTGR